MTPQIFFKSTLISAVLSLGLAACSEQGDIPQSTSTGKDSATTEAIAPSAALLDGSDGANWAAFGRTYGEQHFSPLDEINTDTISRLGLAWYLDIGPGNPVSGPIAVDGVLYTATGYSIVRAIDPTSGSVLWQYDPGVTAVAGQTLRMGWGIRGLAYWDDRILVATHEGRLLALDAKSGALQWSVNTLDDGQQGLFISGPPRVFDGKVIIGSGGADQAAVRGYVTTYDAATGEQLWRFYTVPGNPADGFENDAMTMAAQTWAGEWWTMGGGGTVWNAMTYDPEFGNILLGVGNGGPWNHRIRSAGEGDNLFLSSIVALDAETGDYRWHYQTNPAETWDYNASMDMELADLEIEGESRKVVMTAPKNGFFYVIDRSDGRLISAEPFAKVTWASHIDPDSGRPVEDPAARYPDGTTFTLWPSPVGAHSWLPMAYNPQNQLVYIPVTEMATSYNDVGIDITNWKREPGYAVDGGTNPNFTVDAGPLNKTGALLAWDPVAQKPAWRVENPGPWNGGVMATAGRLVFQGRIDRQFNAYDADSGEQLWSFPTGAVVLAPPITYRAKGKQYVTVLTGMGASASAFGANLPVTVDYRTEPKRVLTFVLDGDAVLPAKSAMALTPPEDPEFEFEQASHDRGLLIFARRCAICHGVDVVSNGHAPELRLSPLSLNQEAFAAVVREGARESAGMPKYSELSDTELADLRQYIRAQARALRELQ